MAEEPTPPTTATRLLAPIVARRGVLTALAVIAGAGWLASTAWKATKQQIGADARYTLNAANIVVTTPPPWVRGDVVAEALESAGLAGGLPAVGPASDLAATLSAALADHPWVAEVERVELLPPNRAAIGLRYRTPRIAATIAGGLTPLDETGVVLPAEGLSAAAIANLPRIQTRSLDAAPPAAGSSWDDPRVQGAVRLITALGSAWEELSLLEAVPLPTPTVHGGRRSYAYRLRSTGQTLIEWGAAPGETPTGEASFAQKLAWLRQYVAEEGPISSVATSPKGLDVRHGLLVERRVVQNESPDSGADEVLR